ncbi:MAG: energy transducer TonB [Bacteroidota bacterium]
MKSKYQLLDLKPFISSEEIEEMKDFDGLMEHFRQAKKEQSEVGKQKIIFMLSSGILAALMGFLYHTEFIKEPATTAEHSDSFMDAPWNAPCEVVADTAVARHQNYHRNVDEKSSARSIENRIVPTPKDKEPAPTRPLTNEERTLKTTEEKASKPIYQEAEPVLGYTHLYEYFNDALRYPKDAVHDSISGTTLVAFTIAEKGVIKDIRIESSLGKSFDREAILLIQNMPRWRPAKLDGNEVASKMRIPLHFQIKHTDK